MPTTIAPPSDMTMAEFCRRIHVSTRTGYEWARQGKIPIRRYGRTIRVLQSALDGFKEE